MFGNNSLGGETRGGNEDLFLGFRFWVLTKRGGAETEKREWKNTYN